MPGPLALSVLLEVTASGPSATGPSSPSSCATPPGAERFQAQRPLNPRPPARPKLTIKGQRGKPGYVLLHPAAAAAVTHYPEASGHADDREVPFRPVKNARSSFSDALTPNGIYQVAKS